MQAGIYVYRLQLGTGTGNTPDPTDWYLVNVGTGGGTMSDEGKDIVDTSGALGLTWMTQVDMLHKRMGELRLNLPSSSAVQPGDKTVTDFWVRSYGQEIEAHSGLAGNPFDEYLWGVDIGADRGFRLSSGWLYTGGYLGYGRTSRDLTDDSDGGTDTVYGGTYATYIGDNGWYLDGVTKFNWFSNSFTATENLIQTVNGNYDNWGLGCSVEGGKRFFLDDKWFVEPQAQAVYAYITQANYTTSDGVQVSVDGTHLGQFRLGGMAGKVIPLSGGGALQPYVKAYGVEAVSSGGVIDASSTTFRPNFDGLRAEAGTGIMWSMNTHSQLYADYEFAAGDKFTKPWGFNAGFRYQW